MNKIIISMLTGIAIGVLIAPAKGSVTRRKLVDGFKDFTDDVSGEADELYENSKGAISTIKSRVEDLVADINTLSEPL